MQIKTSMEQIAVKQLNFLTIVFRNKEREQLTSIASISLSLQSSHLF